MAHVGHGPTRDDVPAAPSCSWWWWWWCSWSTCPVPPRPGGAGASGPPREDRAQEQLSSSRPVGATNRCSSRCDTKWSGGGRRPRACRFRAAVPSRGESAVLRSPARSKLLSALLSGPVVTDHRRCIVEPAAGEGLKCKFDPAGGLDGADSWGLGCPAERCVGHPTTWCHTAVLIEVWHELVGCRTSPGNCVDVALRCLGTDQACRTSTTTARPRPWSGADQRSALPRGAPPERPGSRPCDTQLKTSALRRRAGVQGPPRCGHGGVERGGAPGNPWPDRSPLHGDLPGRHPSGSALPTRARPDLRSAFLATSTSPAGSARLHPAHPERHRPRRSGPPCGSLKGPPTTWASKLPCGSSPHPESTSLSPAPTPRHHPRRSGPRRGSPKDPSTTSASKLPSASSPRPASKSPRPATAHVGHDRARCGDGLRYPVVLVLVLVLVLVKPIVWATSRATARGSRGRRAAATAGSRGAEPPATRGRIDRPGEGTFRGGAPWSPRFRRQHDLTFAQRSWHLRQSPPAQLTSASATSSDSPRVPGRRPPSGGCLGAR